MLHLLASPAAVVCRHGLPALLLLGVLLSGMAAAEADGDHLPSAEQLRADKAKNHRLPATYDPARASWKAQVVAVAAAEPELAREDYATQRYGHPWNFDDNQLGGLKGQRQVENVGVADGRLHYTTRENGEIFWGDHYQTDPGFGEEAIGGAWTGHWNPMRVRMRIKQSLARSQWTVSMCEGQSAWMWRQTSSFTLTGSEWQTVDFAIIDSRVTFRSFSLLCKEAGNDIEIDDVSIYTTHATRQYHYEFDLAEAPVAAAASVCTAPVFALVINDQPVAHEEGGKDMRSILYRYGDLARYFRKGHNTIELDAELCNWTGNVEGMFMEGMARDAKGLIHPFSTGAAWQSRFATPKGAAPNPWQPVRVLGPVPIGYFIEPPYYGRIDLTHADRKCPIFDLQKPVTYAVKLFAPDLPEHVDLVVRELDALADDQVVHEAVLAGDLAPGVREAAYSWTAPHAGVYDIHFALRGRTSGKLLDERFMETAVVGPIAQAEVAGSEYAEGMGLKLIDEIDCTSAGDEHPFISRAGSGAHLDAPIVTTPFGSYRSAGRDTYSYLSWRIEVKDPGKPHVMEIDYPDDASRLVNVTVGVNSEIPGVGVPNDQGERMWNKIGSGVYTGFGNPVTNRMKTLRLVYWPGEPIGAVTIASGCGTPAAVARIRVYEAADLPALRRPTPAFRQTGSHTERLSLLPSTYFAGEDGVAFAENLRLWPHRGFYKDWYQTNVNLIRHMRFMSENLLIVGVHMYDVAEYPSPSYPLGWAAQADPLELLARMFARNGLAVSMGLEYGCPPELDQTGFSVTDAQVAAGAPTQRFVDRAGRQAPRSYCSSLNIFAPQVEAGLHRVVKELCDLYKDTPGIIGVHLQGGGSLNPGLWSDQQALGGPEGATVDDVTIGQFQRDTGITVPADKVGVQRFAQRNDWLDAHAREQWIAWRCKRIFGINRTVLDALQKANPRWQLSIAMQSFAFPAGPQRSFLEGYRLQGYDPALYDQPGFMLQFGNNPLYIRGVTENRDGLDPRLNRDPAIVAGFIRPGRPFMREVGGGFFEPGLNADASWYWSFQLQIPYPLPVGRNILQGYNSTLLDGPPQVLVQHWLDVNGIGGNEQLLRLFNRAFTALPPGDYPLLTGNGLDRNLVIRAGPKGFYVINPLPVAIAGQLRTAGGGTVTDLSSGEKFPAARGVKLQLEPYGLATFGLDGASVTGFAETSDAVELTARYAATMASAKDTIDAIRTRVAANEAFAGHAPEMKRLVDLADASGRLLAGGGVGQASLILDGAEWKGLLSAAADLAHPQCWSVIGPFDNTGRKAFTTVLPAEVDLLAGHPQPSYPCALAKPAAWHEVLASAHGNDRGLLDFAALFGHDQSDNRLGYATATIRSAREFDGELWLGSDDSLAVWVNGAEVFRLATGRAASPGSDKVPVHLRQGDNTVLLKLDNGTGGWALYFDLRDQAGNPASGIDYRSPPIPVSAK